ncbi:MAG: DUF2062 domain-containing protein [Rhizobiales bacterium]|nr:DUF2062 domain-containing protein [Hyphomicrobiales bacterium]
MLFGRRDKPDLAERVRVFFWPRRGWVRSSRYVLKRVLRLSGSPHAIALGVGAGVFASFTPFMGFHFILAGLIAWLIGGNLIAAALGTFIGNPLTFPFIWAATYGLGNWILGVNTNAALVVDLGPGFLEGSFESLLPIMKPMFVSGIPLGILVALMVYFPVRSGIDMYQQRRRDQLRANGDGNGQGTEI